MSEVNDSTPMHITNVSLPQSYVPTPAGEVETEVETPSLTVNDGETDSGAEPDEAAKAAAEAKALEEQREAEAKEKLAEEKRAKFERAKRIADKESQKVAERRALQMQARRAEEQRQQYAHQLQARDAELQRYKQAMEEFQRDPLAHMERLGVKPEDIAKRALEDNTPETKFAKLQEELRAEREAFARERQELLRSQQEAQRAQAIEAGRRDFVTRASDADKYPALARLAEHDPRGLLREAESVLREAYAAEGVQYTDQEVRDFLETKYSRLMNLSTQTTSSGKSASSSTKPETNLGSSAQEKPAAGRPLTLTNKANTRGTAPPSFDDLDDAEQKRLMVELYRSKRRSG